MADKRKKWPSSRAAQHDMTPSVLTSGVSDSSTPSMLMSPEPDDHGDMESGSRVGAIPSGSGGSGTVEDDVEVFRRESERERLAAADALDDWISAENPSNAPILRRLESDIRASRKLNEWGAFSLDDLLRPPAYDHARHWAARLASTVTLARNLMLFLPVFFTWIAVDIAAKAYEKNRVGETFLQVWNAQNFDLSRVARLDAVLIGSLVILTLLAHGLESHAEAHAMRRDEEADNRFRGVMVNVGLYLHGFRQITPAALSGGLADSVNQLVVATTAMKEAAESMELVTDRGSKTLTEFAELSAKEFAPASERLAKLADTLEAAAGTHRDLSELVKTLQEHLSGTVGTMDARMRELIADLVTQMKENVDSVVVSTVEVGDRIDAIGGHLQAASATTLAAVEALYRHWRDGEGGRGIPRA